MALTDKLVNIADAIRSKTNSTAEMTLDQMPGKIRGITTSGGGVSLPELDNPATASDLASGKQLIDGNGNVIEGMVPVVTDTARYLAYDIWDSNSGLVDEQYVSEYPNCVQIYGVIHDEMLLRGHPGMFTYVPKYVFGDASPSDVLKGKTFTSESGVQVEGTMEAGGGNGLAYDMGEFVFDADTVNAGLVRHNLGEHPDFVLVWTDDFAGKANPDTGYATTLGFV